MRLQTSTLLAVLAVLELSNGERRQLSVTALSEKYGVSSHHLAKVMNELARAGYVRAARGAGGGYHFVGNAKRLTLLDVMLGFEDLGPANGANGNGAHTPELRALGEVLSEIDDIARATLGSITLETMRKLVDRHRGNSRAGLRITVRA
jgi:Rrf2 family protein